MIVDFDWLAPWTGLGDMRKTRVEPRECRAKLVVVGKSLATLVVGILYTESCVER